METRSAPATPQPHQHLAAILHYSGLQVIRLDIYGISTALQGVPPEFGLGPFVQLDMLRNPQQRYSNALREALDRLISLGLVEVGGESAFLLRHDRLRAYVSGVIGDIEAVHDRVIAANRAAAALRNACRNRPR